MSKTDNPQDLNLTAPRLAVSALIINPEGKILLVKDKKNQQWRAPSFSFKNAATPEECLITKVKEVLNLNLTY